MNIPYLIALRISGQLAGVCLSGIWLLTGLLSQAASTPPSAASAKYQFDGTISRTVLENFLARSISVEGVFNGRGDLEDNLRMLKSIGVKYAGRSLCLWGAERDFLANLERARQQVPKAIAADPQMVLQAFVFNNTFVMASRHPLLFRALLRHPSRSPPSAPPSS